MRSTPARAVLALALLVPLAGCTSDEPAEQSAGTSAPASAVPLAPETSAAPVPTGPFGAGCQFLPPDGEGSIAGMADDPVAAAAANNPALSALVRAVQAANLVDTLNTTPEVTVLAPANPAFEAVPADALNALLVDTPRLTAVLTHHVIPGRLGPGELAGTHTTLNNDRITIEGEGETFTVSADQTLVGAADATVICGNVPVANATLYLVDQVLAPAP
ncbi:fasciclin domain-containing protein [Geodermatophilus ruber]|uniref:Uncaracterized surface protein containing fasciclin (FAS1) repeats n=1 Tax=Geodermatophilus ruber TaxID=504800 RepID=A0A1I3Z5A9_9ACTN|nr:fasciclin domain-containing protein [Geodermatophilus ruber]SFK39167.1 Uncaracterized surface protein containing fasciclin (FAS1) repeats [Geodermatophilus ruber]